MTGQSSSASLSPVALLSISAADQPSGDVRSRVFAFLDDHERSQTWRVIAIEREQQRLRSELYARATEAP